MISTPLSWNQNWKTSSFQALGPESISKQNRQVTVLVVKFSFSIIHVLELTYYTSAPVAFGSKGAPTFPSSVPVPGVLEFAAA